MVSTAVMHAITCLTTNLPTPEERKAELAWLADPWRTLYLQSGHLSPDLYIRHRSEEVRQPKTDVLTTEPCHPNRRTDVCESARGEGMRVCVVSSVCPVSFSLLATLSHPLS